MLYKINKDCGLFNNKILTIQKYGGVPMDIRKKVDLFDFSGVKVGDRLTQIYGAKAFEAKVLEITNDEIRCSLDERLKFTDSKGYGIGIYDKKMGVSKRCGAFGFIINRSPEESYDFMQGYNAKSRLRELDNYNTFLFPSDDNLISYDR